MDSSPPIPAEAEVAIPPGFRPLPLGRKGYMHVNGPLFARRDGEILVTGFRVETRHCNPAGICHGGMLMTFADMQLPMGAKFQARIAGFIPTVSLNADFLAPAPHGAWVEGRTEVLRSTRNLLFAQCVITADGAPAVRASGIFKIGHKLDQAFREIDLHALLP